MKYIRTKDGNILERKEVLGYLYYENRTITSYYFNEQNNLSLNDFLKERGGIIKQSDSIEELCDAFVDTSELETTNTGGWLYDEFDSKNKCLVYYDEDEKRTIPLNEYNDLSKIYGAIFTDKGLIYVAKMNDKGELELL